LGRTENRKQPDSGFRALPSQVGSAGLLRGRLPAAGGRSNRAHPDSRLFGSVITAWVVAAALALAVVGLSVAWAVGNSAPAGLRAPIVSPRPSCTRDCADAAHTGVIGVSGGNPAPLRGNFGPGRRRDGDERRLGLVHGDGRFRA